MKRSYIDIHTHHPREYILTPTMAGIHPWDAEQTLPMPNFAECDIIGETGLDYVCGVNREAQERLFRIHLAEAARLNKPVVLHVVKAFEPAMRILGEYPLQGVVFHGFVGSKQQATRAVNEGYYLSFGTRSLRSPKTCEAIVATPLEQLFVETDDDGDVDIATIYEAIAKIKSIDPNTLAEQTAENYNRLFNQI